MTTIIFQHIVLPSDLILGLSLYFQLFSKLCILSFYYKASLAWSSSALNKEAMSVIYEFNAHGFFGVFRTYNSAFRSASGKQTLPLAATVFTKSEILKLPFVDPALKTTRSGWRMQFLPWKPIALLSPPIRSALPLPRIC